MLIGKRINRIQSDLVKLTRELTSTRTNESCMKLLEAERAFGEFILEIKTECPARLDEDEWF